MRHPWETTTSVEIEKFFVGIWRRKAADAKGTLTSMSKNRTLCQGSRFSFHFLRVNKIEISPGNRNKHDADSLLIWKTDGEENERKSKKKKLFFGTHASVVCKLNDWIRFVSHLFSEESPKKILRPWISLNWRM